MAARSERRGAGAAAGGEARVSAIIWDRLLLPDLDAAPVAIENSYYRLRVENALPYPDANESIPIPDPRAFRSMSRAAIFISHICASASTALRPYLEASPFSVGIYCAVESGPIDAVSTAKIVEQGDRGRFAEHYRRFRNPKLYLRQLPNLVAAQMGISLGIQGPLNVYTHSTAASLHALEQAEWDLRQGGVKAALVCTAHAFDDFLVLRRERESDPRVMTEGAAALLLVKNGEMTAWSGKSRRHATHFFGISDLMINLLLGGAHGKS